MSVTRSAPIGSGRRRQDPIGDSAAPAAIPLLILGFFALWAPNTANPLLTAASGLALAALVGMLWRSGEPPVLLFAASMQWLQVSAKVIHGNLLGQSVETMFGHEIISTAILMCLLGLVVLGYGMKVAAGPRDPRRHGLGQQLLSFSPRKLLIAYVAAYFASAPLGYLAGAIPSLSQPLLVLIGVRWFFYFILACTVLSRKRDYSYLAFAFGMELVAGLGGFFSDFKQVFFVTGVAYLTVRIRVSLSTVLVAAVMGVCLLALSVVWTAVKGEYRAAIMQGGGGFSTLYEMVQNQNEDTLTDAVGRFGERLAYTDYFALSLFYVPQSVAHANGELWGRAIMHVLVPRLLYPDKPIIDNSELTRRYTGEDISDGTSVSIGYMGESYIDFGSFGLYGPVFVLGLIWGKFYASLSKHKAGPAYGYSAAVMVLIGAVEFERALPKLVGGIIILFIVIILWMKFALPRIKPLIED